MVQMCLAPIWKAYEVLEPGSDVGGILGRMSSKIDLSQEKVHFRSLTHHACQFCDCCANRVCKLAVPFSVPQNLSSK